MLFVISLGAKHLYNARDERIAERRQRQSEGTDALWTRGLLRKTRDQQRRSARSHSYTGITVKYDENRFKIMRLSFFRGFFLQVFQKAAT